MRHLEKRGPHRGTNHLCTDRGCGGELLSGGEETKGGDSGLDVRKNLPSPRQAGEPPPLGVKDVLKHPRQMFVYVNTSVPWAREQVWRLLGLQPCFSVICMHILACERVRSPMRLSHHKHAFWIWNRSSRTYCFCCVFVICSESC